MYMKTLQPLSKLSSHKHFDDLISFCIILIMFHILEHAANVISNSDVLINLYNIVLC